MKNEKITSNITIKIDSTCLDKDNKYFNHTITLQEKNKELFHLNVRHNGDAYLAIKQEIIDADKLQQYKQYEHCIGTINNIQSFNNSIKSLIDKTTNNTERKNSEAVIKQLITELLVNQMGLTSQYNLYRFKNSYDFRIYEGWNWDNLQIQYIYRDGEMKHDINNANLIINNIQQTNNQQQKSESIIQNICQWCLNHCCSCCLDKT
ncbi:MAG: hypothetical protein IJT15_01675 [Rickettsiales bacterium]|nr:hypothetical protein [Rickettsiales bacterium]